MFKPLYFVCIFACLSFVFSCKQNPVNQVPETDSLEVSVVDTALYGKCGEGTSMHNVQLVDDDGRAQDFIIADGEEAVVKGGLLVGDLLTLTYCTNEEGNCVTGLVNLTTLLGRWSSLDRNFEIHEDGTITSNVSAESYPYTAWTMLNSKLLLNTDTFDIVTLGADTLELENSKGIFVYKRIR